VALRRSPCVTSKKNDDLIGYWRITKMDVWGQAYVAMVVPGFIEFEMEDDHLIG